MKFKNPAEARKFLKEEAARDKASKEAKTYKGEWYTVNSILGNDWARFYYLLGGR